MIKEYNKKMERDFRRFRKKTERESNEYLERELEEIKQFLRNSEDNAREIMDRYVNYPQFDYYTALFNGHVTGLAIKLIAAAQI